MLNGRDTCIALAKHGTTLCVDDVLSNRIDNGLSVEVDTLNLITRILWGRIKCYSQVQTCMQSFSEK